MIIRIVRMHFTNEGVDEFLRIFDENKHAIRTVPGCSHLELLKDVKDDCCYTTLSHWDHETSLNNYRHSELFESVWQRVKKLHAQKTQAFSLEKYLEIEPL